MYNPSNPYPTIPSTYTYPARVWQEEVEETEYYENGAVKKRTIRRFFPDSSSPTEPFCRPLNIC